MQLYAQPWRLWFSAPSWGNKITLNTHRDVYSHSSHTHRNRRDYIWEHPSHTSSCHSPGCAASLSLSFFHSVFDLWIPAASIKHRGAGTTDKSWAILQLQGRESRRSDIHTHNIRHVNSVNVAGGNAQTHTDPADKDAIAHDSGEPCLTKSVLKQMEKESVEKDHKSELRGGLTWREMERWRNKEWGEKSDTEGRGKGCDQFPFLIALHNRGRSSSR